MSAFVLKAEPREPGRPRATRREGFVPAVLYGGDGGNLTLKLPRSEVIRMMGQHGGRGLLQLNLGGKPHTVMIKEVQRDPARGDVLHIDFYRVSMTEKVQTTVPLRFEGEEAVTDTGAVIQLQLREVEIACLPRDLPQEIVVNVSGLRPGHALTVGDLQAPPGVQILNDPEQVIAAAVMPRAAETAGQQGAAGAGEGEAEAGEGEAAPADEDQGD